MFGAWMATTMVALPSIITRQFCCYCVQRVAIGFVRFTVFFLFHDFVSFFLMAFFIKDCCCCCRCRRCGCCFTIECLGYLKLRFSCLMRTYRTVHAQTPAHMCSPSHVNNNNEQGRSYLGLPMSSAMRRWKRQRQREK